MKIKYTGGELQHGSYLSINNVRISFKPSSIVRIHRYGDGRVGYEAMGGRMLLMSVPNIIVLDAAA